MADERATAPSPEWAAGGTGLDPASAELAELRELLVGAERRQLEALGRRLDELGISPESLAEHLPQAIALRAARDRQLARALAPTVEGAIGESVRRNPREIATAIFPVLGPAIRKAIAEAMAGLVASINRGIEHSLTIRGLRWRLEAWRSGVPYAQVVLRHALVYRVEQVYLIHGDTGLLLAHAAIDPGRAEDGDLISGMLTAIRDFVADSFSSHDAGGLRTFTVGELTVMVEQGPQAVIAAVVRGQPPDTLLRSLQETLETVHLRLAGAFADFDGDTASFEAARPLLEECLVTVTREDRSRPGTRALVWAIPLLLLIAAPIWLLVRSNRRWDAAVGRLRAEPGIVLVSAERSAGQWRFAGLRDPLGADPLALLASTGADTSRVTARWERYQSLHPALVLTRARQMLEPPASAALSLDGEILRVTGPVPVDWAARMAALTILPGGVARLDLSGTEPAWPDSLLPLLGEIRASRVLFEVGSARLTAEGMGVVETVAAQVGRLARALPPGFGAGLELVGRTDSSGSDAANRSLSDLRAEAVRSALAARGVPASIRAVGIGTSSPLPAPDAGQADRVNRSVSFEVSLQSAAAAARRAP